MTSSFQNQKVNIVDYSNGKHINSPHQNNPHSKIVDKAGTGIKLPYPLPNMSKKSKKDIQSGKNSEKISIE